MTDPRTDQFRARRLRLLTEDGLDEETRLDLPREQALAYGQRAGDELEREEASDRET